MTSTGKQPRGLAALFPCCYRESDQPEITYCHENVMQMEPTIPMPPLQELDAKFTEVVDELGLPEQQRAAMFAMPAEKKWQIYCSRKMVRNFTKSPSQLKSVLC
uniref:Formin GTPase-binding domain-containing protein n=1 Tax=Fundulus heteroclitus TaxID=8078 RepID=A0A3Q2NRF9_FUNHE